MKTIDPAARRKSRLYLLFIALVFTAPVIVAGLLTFGGWQPVAKGNGQSILPQRNFVDEKLHVELANHQPYAWRDSKPRLTLVALAGPGCAAQCLATLTSMAAARITLNRNMSRLRLLYLGTPPANDDRDGMLNYWQLGTDVEDKLAIYRPTAPDSVSALLVESNGTALSLYPAGFDPSGLRKDLQRVIR
jgi:cytochrome oxidase Cu insertion factor (SCO1/SenC/PrrC family)